MLDENLGSIKFSIPCITRARITAKAFVLTYEIQAYSNGKVFSAIALTTLVCKVLGYGRHLGDVISTSKRNGDNYSGTVPWVGLNLQFTTE